MVLLYLLIKSVSSAFFHRQIYIFYSENCIPFGLFEWKTTGKKQNWKNDKKSNNICIYFKLFRPFNCLCHIFCFSSSSNSVFTFCSSLRTLNAFSDVIIALYLCVYTSLSLCPLHLCLSVCLYKTFLLSFYDRTFRTPPFI